VIELNRIVAVAMADGPGRALAQLDTVAGDLDRYYLFHSTKADLLRRLDRPDEAAVSYRRALDLVTNVAERGFLERRLAEVSALTR
jgi:RNA polymerase sigma-70 factor (ECF subfamily)